MSHTRIFSSRIHLGALTLQEAAIWFALALIVTVAGFAIGGGLFNRADYSQEFTNAAEMMTNARSMLKTAGAYDFSSAEAMTGALIQRGGAPSGMKVVGTPSSGTATLQNVWGGATTVGPVSNSGGQNTSFGLTFNLVPQEACIQMVQKMSSASNVASTSVNGTTTTGAVSSDDVGVECQADNGSIGVNVLVFNSNT
ncbi:prepilin [Rahnella sp. BCC 1045]|uniref:type 4 pilus major pilin n=1 Tax=Rahnella sp. BCC 1045 TaxID=2816251 RepID=UPI001C263E3F|nr:type 4 pilus major pilin [Rahnella sp. BCC 1045]MBU9819678.1 prepilin [Rahnella sp. BCC 1045]